MCKGSRGVEHPLNKQLLQGGVRFPLYVFYHKIIRSRLVPGTNLGEGGVSASGYLFVLSYRVEGCAPNHDVLDITVGL